jgi:hypothetical protein
MCVFYLYNLPLVFAVRLDGGGLRFGVGAFRARPKKRTPRRRKIKFPKKRVPVELVLRVLKSVELERLDVNLTLGTGDAALTAQACGLIVAVVSMLRALTGAAGQLRVTPDFTGRAFAGEARGIARLRLGHIMKAALLFILRGAGG